MWTTQIVGKQEIEGVLYISVKYSNQTNSFTETYNIFCGKFTREWLEDIIYQKIEILEYRGSLKENLELGEFVFDKNQVKERVAKRKKEDEDKIKEKP